MQTSYTKYPNNLRGEFHAPSPPSISLCVDCGIQIRQPLNFQPTSSFDSIKSANSAARGQPPHDHHHQSHQLLLTPKKHKHFANWPMIYEVDETFKVHIYTEPFAYMMRLLPIETRHREQNRLSFISLRPLSPQMNRRI